MDPSKKQSEINEYIKTGEYYKYARLWYNRIFILPILYKSIYSVKIFLFIILFLTIALNLISILPMSKGLRYKVDIQDTTQMKANIKKIDSKSDSVINSIAKILINDYVISRESYEYEKLLAKYEYIQNSSSDSEYQRFKNYMSLNNQNSPILKYQKDSVREIKISSIVINKDNAEIYFSATSINIMQDIIENKLWKVVLGYKIDNINVHAKGAFGFLVTQYHQELIKDLIEVKK